MRGAAAEDNNTRGGGGLSLPVSSPATSLSLVLRFGDLCLDSMICASNRLVVLRFGDVCFDLARNRALSISFPLSISLSLSLHPLCPSGSGFHLWRWQAWWQRQGGRFVLRLLFPLPLPSSILGGAARSGGARGAVAVAVLVLAARVRWLGRVGPASQWRRSGSSLSPLGVSEAKASAFVAEA